MLIAVASIVVVMVVAESSTTAGPLAAIVRIIGITVGLIMLQRASRRDQLSTSQLFPSSGPSFKRRMGLLAADQRCLLKKRARSRPW